MTCIKPSSSRHRQLYTTNSTSLTKMHAIIRFQMHISYMDTDNHALPIPHLFPRQTITHFQCRISYQDTIIHFKLFISYWSRDNQTLQTPHLLPRHTLPTQNLLPRHRQPYTSKSTPLTRTKTNKTLPNQTESLSRQIIHLKTQLQLLPRHT